VTASVRDIQPRRAPLAPGLLLRAELSARNLTQADLAARTGLSAKHINQVLMATATMTPKVAWSLEQALGIDVGLLLAMDAQHQATKVRAKSLSELDAHVGWAARFPLEELRRRGLVDQESGPELVARLLAFFGVSNKESFERLYLAGVVGFRRSQHNNVDDLATATWLRLAELQVQEHPVQDFDIQKLRKLIPLLLEVTHLDDDEGFRQARRLLATCGVALSFVPDIQGCRASGATKWLPSGRPLIVITDRYKKSDSMWFSLFHELGHVVLHPKRITIISLPADGDDAEGYEEQANDYAACLVVPPEFLPELDSTRTKAGVEAFAERVTAHVSLVAGQWAHRADDYRTVAKLRPKLDVEAMTRAADSPP
jgi:HTH-type transcriptional regulator / antitoxin HigA